MLEQKRKSDETWKGKYCFQGLVILFLAGDKYVICSSGKKRNPLWLLLSIAEFSGLTVVFFISCLFIPDFAVPCW